MRTSEIKRANQILQGALGKLGESTRQKVENILTEKSLILSGILDQFVELNIVNNPTINLRRHDWIAFGMILPQRVENFLNVLTGEIHQAFDWKIILNRTSDHTSSSLYFVANDPTRQIDFGGIMVSNDKDSNLFVEAVAVNSVNSAFASASAWGFNYAMSQIPRDKNTVASETTFQILSQAAFVLAHKAKPYAK